MSTIYNNNLSGCGKLCATDIVKLGLLAAIWGASFVAMRIAVQETGALLAALLRVVVAAIALTVFAQIKQIPLQWRGRRKPYALVGLFGAALPFALFSYASLYLPAAFSALLNATCPLFVALFSILWLQERLTLYKLLGLILGMAGVWLMMATALLPQNKFNWLALIACLLGPACFAISAIVIKLNSCAQNSDGIHPLAMAAGSMIIASAMMLPILPFALPPQLPSAQSLGFILALGLLPSALAQVIFIPLIGKIGPTRAMSVSFLIPLFSIIWGLILLQEAIPLVSLLGGGAVIAATALMLKT